MSILTTRLRPGSMGNRQRDSHAPSEGSEGTGKQVRAGEVDSCSIVTATQAVPGGAPELGCFRYL